MFGKGSIMRKAPKRVRERFPEALAEWEEMAPEEAVSVVFELVYNVREGKKGLFFHRWEDSSGKAIKSPRPPVRAEYIEGVMLNTEEAGVGLRRYTF